MSGGRTQVSLQPAVLRWARERVRLTPDELADKVGVKTARVLAWEDSGKISFAQTNNLAHHSHTPLGFLFLPEPPEDRLPIPDLRTVSDRAVERPSPDLLESVQIMQRRQAWMRDELIEEGVERLSFVGKVDSNAQPAMVAAAMRAELGLADNWAQRMHTWDNALRYLRNLIDAAGILVVMSGVVGNNSYRKLDPDEFRGFVLTDDYAPLIFINGTDALAAKIFTIVHELAHVWIGAPGVSNFEVMQAEPHTTEKFCNAVAAEFLVPESELKDVWAGAQEDLEPFSFLARRFKVSSLVASRRALDLDLISRKAFFDFYHSYLDDERRQPKPPKGGGDFWNNQNVRIGHRFGAAVVRAVKEGRLLYRDAYSLTGLNGKTFDNFVEKTMERL